MKKLFILFILVFAALINMAADRDNLRIRTGYTMLTRPLALNASDTINASDTVTFTITNLQKYFQHQTFSIGLDSVSGTPDVTITAYGRVTDESDWTAIGSAISWSSDSNDGDITSTAPYNYNYLKVEFIAGSGAQQTLINAFEVKTSNMYDIPANSGTLTVSRATEGTVTITSADNNANAALTIGAGGTGALTLGDATSTTAITSTDWAIGATGAMTGIGAITADGLITANAGVTLGAGDDLIGSSTSDITIGTTAFTVAGATGDVGVGNDLTVTGESTFNDDLQINASIDIDITSTADEYVLPAYVDWRTGADMTSGGSYGVWGLARVSHSVQNALGAKGQVYFGSLASDAKVVNQCRGVEGAIDLDTDNEIGVLDDISSIGGYLGPYNSGDVTTTAGGTVSILDLVYMPETNMSVETHGIKLTAKSTSAGPRMDYGLRIQNQGISTANIYLENENLANTSVTNDIMMSNTAGDVTNGINMSAAAYSGADVITSSGAKIFTGSAATGDAVYAEVGAYDATGSIYISTAGAMYVQVANAGAATDWFKVTTSDAD